MMNILLLKISSATKMGKYYGVVNVTRHIRVASYWKGYPPDENEMLRIIKFFGWSETDCILASSYADSYRFEHGTWTGISGECGPDITDDHSDWAVETPDESECNEISRSKEEGAAVTPEESVITYNWTDDHGDGAIATPDDLRLCRERVDDTYFCN
jgi:hypothetical protein